EGPWSEREGPLDVWTPRGRRAFPRHLLGTEPDSHGAVLPALLESLPLALLSYASGHHDELQAYMRLIELGSARSRLVDPYDSANPELAAWIIDGTVSVPQNGYEPAPLPPEGDAGTADSAPADRAAAMVRFLDEIQAGVDLLDAKEVTLETS